MSDKIAIVLSIIGIIIVGAILGILIANMASSEDSTQEPEIQESQLYVSFQDSENSCILNGKIYTHDVYLGETEKGALLINESQMPLGSNIITIYGETGDCFGSDKGLNFVESWEVPLSYYFETQDAVIFETKVDPRVPGNFREVQGFIRPKEVENYLAYLEKYFDDDLEDNLDKIAKFNMRYRYDNLMYGKGYWQTPLETLDKGYGDCEDWTVAVTSLIRAYDENVQCYALIFENHMSVFCIVEDKYIIYDQGEKYSEIILEDSVTKENELNSLLNEYFSDLNFKTSEKKIQGVANDVDYSKFNSNQEFVDWVLSR